MSSTPKRPRSVTILTWGVFLLGVWNVARAVVLTGQLGLLREQDGTLDPFWRLGLAAIWGILFIGLALMLWQRRSLVRVLLPVFLAVYELHNLALLVFFVQSPFSRQAWPAQLLAAVLAVMFALWVLYRQPNASYFET